ncbi:hypothetical protein F2Q68_00025150 [Brassica cretica]|uniref:Uncharacterized protein n=1 Tax=Brassica cretica TaxID=69181 RepID=A0A8S9IDW0_BRACR|nr:hypothetical protein F2Q68_00025150 [Brassica cretica]
MQITNAFDASLVILNPQVQEAVDFKERMLQAELPLANVENKPDYKAVKQQAEDWDDVCSISEILVAVEAQKCKIVCSIESINTDWGWFFLDMMQMDETTVLLGSVEMILEELHKMKNHYGVVRTVVLMSLICLQNDSDTCKLMLLDSIGKNVIGYKAVELWNGSYDEAISLIESGLSTFSPGEVSKFDPNSQNSAEYVTTPFSKQKDNDDLPDVTSASKKLCTDTIKLEKTKTE